MCTSPGGATIYAADVFRFSPSLEKFRAVPSIGHSRHLPNPQPAFVIKLILSQGRHFRDSPSKRRNYSRSVTSRKTRIFNFTYRSRCNGKVLVVPLLDMKVCGGLEVQPHTFVMKIRCRFSLGGKNPWYPLNGKSVGPRAHRDPWKKNISCLCQESNRD